MRIALIIFWIIFRSTNSIGQIVIEPKDNVETVQSKIDSMSVAIKVCSDIGSNLKVELDKIIQEHLEWKYGLTIYKTNVEGEIVFYAFTHYGIISYVENFPNGLNCNGDYIRITKDGIPQWWKKIKSKEILRLERRSRY